MLAASNGHKNIVENLIDAGADVNVENNVKSFFLSDNALSNSFLKFPAR